MTAMQVKRLSPISRAIPTLREMATDSLRAAILDGRLEPGSRLIEREICALLEVSRTSVREALRHLETEGLIRTIPHKGPVVATLTPAEAREIYEVRAVLEGLAGECFAVNATAKMVTALSKLAGEIDTAVGRGDTDRILAAKTAFYALLFEGAGNGICRDLVAGLNTRIWLLRRLSLGVPGRAQAMLLEIQEITKAAAARDPERTRDACIRHVQSASDVVMERLADETTVKGIG